MSTRNIFDNRKVQNKNEIQIGKIMIITIVMVIFLMVVANYIESRYSDGKKYLEDAISRDVVHCYCVEGFYPPDIDYMVKHYGLKYDKSKYLVTYKIIGNNIMPEYEVTEVN